MGLVVEELKIKNFNDDKEFCILLKKHSVHTSQLYNKIEEQKIKHCCDDKQHNNSLNLLSSDTSPACLLVSPPTTLSGPR